MAKNKGGRPSEMSEEKVKKLEEVFAIDGTIEEACFYADISKQTYYDWLKRKPELIDRFDALRNRPVLKARQTVVKSLDNPDHAFKYLEKKRKKEFGNAVDLTSGGEKITGFQFIKPNGNTNDNSDDKTKSSLGEASGQ